MSLYYFQIGSLGRALKTYISADFSSIENFTKPSKNKHWENIYNEGNAKDVFFSYSS